MKINITSTIALTLSAMMGVVSAATFTVTTTASDGVGSFSRAIRDADASADPANTIAFNIAGVGPHYIAPPVGGFPLIIKDNTTVDGYSQPGSAVNTKPITQTNNAVIKIALDARAPNANFRDMAYVGYGSVSVSDPVINNSVMYGDGTTGAAGRERGGYDPTTWVPYVPGEVAILGIYRATNVTIKGLAFLSGGSGADYGIAIAQDYGLDTTVRDRFAYDQGSSRGFHIAGCSFGTDPGTGADAESGAAIAAYRHRDKATGGTRPELPNLEKFTIGVKADSTNPRAEFNVIKALALTLIAEGTRCRISGNQFSGAPIQIGGYDDTQVPSILYGTDGDGVNDADEGNLFLAPPTQYGAGNEYFVFAGNTFNLALDGSRPGIGYGFAFDKFDLGSRSRVRFGSDFNGVSDDLEANRLYDTTGFPAIGAAPDATAWVSLRGNVLVNNTTLPRPATDVGVFNKFADLVAPITPAFGAATVNSFSGTCSAPLPAVKRVIVDLYLSDPEGDTASDPQGKTWLGSFMDNSLADSNPAAGAFTFNIASLGLAAGTKVTMAVTYSVDTEPTITSVARSGGNTTVTISGGTPNYNIQRAPAVTGPYTTISVATGTTKTFADAAATSFYRVRSGAASGQTSPFATSVAVP